MIDAWRRKTEQKIAGLNAAAGRAASVMGRRVGRTAGRAAGFTLVEILVSIGAVAVISVGLAAIFQTIGQTVSQGQKVSALTQYAAVLEQQMRRDFSSITREGFLVIRNQFAGPRNSTPGNAVNTPVGINKDDPNPRNRRVDEILFFTKGEYETARAPINGNLIARSDSAMIYYGHGLLPKHEVDADGRPRQVNGTPIDLRPSVSNLNNPDPASGDYARGQNLQMVGGGGVFGEFSGGRPLPNSYAENWTLLRKQTLLASPKTTRESFPARGWPQQLRGAAGGVAPTSRLSENEVQIACQPAASHVFRSLARVVSIIAPGNLNANSRLARTVTGQGGDSGAHFPQLSSGLVDIATCDLNEIRTIVQTFQVDPDNANPAAVLSAYQSVNYDFNNPVNANFDGKFRTNNTDVNRMRSWMLNALPTRSDRYDNAGAGITATDPKAARVRYEPSPPDYLNVLSELQTGNGESAVALLTRRADQSMIAQGGILPRCTEFIVEWSFGRSVMANGQPAALRWYGGHDDTTFKFTRYNRGANDAYKPFADRRGLPDSLTGHVVSEDLIYGTGPNNDEITQSACFGYFDPFYVPQAGDLPVAPWAWPKLVRITVAMVDEREPLKEERFQWVFEMPGTPDPQ